MAGIDVNGDPVVLEIGWPHRSFITKIVVVQTEGVMEAFTVAIFNHSVAATNAVISDSVSPGIGPVPLDCFRVTHDISSDSPGSLIYLSEKTGSGGFGVFSQEQLPTRSGRSDRVYLRITPSTSNAKKFAVLLGGEKEE
jgi:hypothetical protein